MCKKRTITIDSIPAINGQPPTVFSIPHECEPQDFLRFDDLNDPSPMVTLIDVVHLRREDWFDVDYCIEVLVWAGECAKCKQDYQAWIWRNGANSSWRYE